MRRRIYLISVASDSLSSVPEAVSTPCIDRGWTGDQLKRKDRPGRKGHRKAPHSSVGPRCFQALRLRVSALESSTVPIGA